MDAHPSNVSGEFYVEKDCCSAASRGHIAPELFAYDDSGCWVARQPSNVSERRKMLKVTEMQELGCVRSRGNQVQSVSSPSHSEGL
jgi:hypothetical protein